MAVTMETEEATTTQTQGVVFQLGAEEYCIDISHVDEIVERAELTPLPNTRPHVEGVMDLRGQTTQIFNPRSYFTIDPEESSGERILILDQDGRNVGWTVDSVDRVIEYSEDEIDGSVQAGAIDGVLHRDDTFIIVINPLIIED